MKELAGGKISSDIIDLNPTPAEDFIFELSLDRVDMLIGKNVGIVCNLAPRAMMGGKYVSEGMIVAADTEKGAASIAFFPDDTVGFRIH